MNLQNRSKRKISKIRSVLSNHRYNLLLNDIIVEYKLLSIPTSVFNTIKYENINEDLEVFKKKYIIPVLHIELEKFNSTLKEQGYGVKIKYNPTL